MRDIALVWREEDTGREIERGEVGYQDNCISTPNEILWNTLGRLEPTVGSYW